VIDQQWRKATWILVAFFAVTEVAANLAAAAYKIALGPALIPGGAFLIPISLLLRDSLHLRHPRTALIAALMTGALASTLFNLEVARIALASVLAFMISFGVDSVVFSRLSHRPMYVRMRASNWASLPIDTLIFVPIAFYGLFPIGPLLLGQLIVKLGMTELAIGLYRIGRRWLTRREFNEGWDQYV